MPKKHRGISSDFKSLAEEAEDTRISIFSISHTLQMDYSRHHRIVRHAQSLYKMSVDFKNGIDEYIRIASKLNPVTI
jgi:hypothetical protein